MKSYVKALAGITGSLYVIYGILALYNWVSETFPLNVNPIGSFLTLNVPSDIGASIALITIGLTLMLPLFSGNNNVQGLSTLTVGTFLAVALFALQILIIMANIADTLILSSVGEEVEYNILDDIQRIEFYGGALSLVLMYYVIKELSRRKIITSIFSRRK